MRRRDFTGKQLLITEFEMQWPSYSPPVDNSPAGRFVHSAVNSGAHACFYAAAIVAGIDSGGVIGSINHHALGAGEPGVHLLLSDLDRYLWVVWLPVNRGRQSIFRFSTRPAAGVRRVHVLVQYSYSLRGICTSCCFGKLGHWHAGSCVRPCVMLIWPHVRCTTGSIYSYR
jgi:hypothetical protein